MVHKKHEQAAPANRSETTESREHPWETSGGCRVETEIMRSCEFNPLTSVMEEYSSTVDSSSLICLRFCKRK